MKNLPPLRSLVAFAAAARHLSFTKAAEELFVTPGAVGQLIQKLETWLGVKLFLRDVRKIALTEAGTLYYLSIIPALQQIAHATDLLKRRRQDAIHLSMPPSFARKWFVPRMAQFTELHPEISLHIDTSAALVDFDEDAFDLAIRHCKAQPNSKLDMELLLPDELRVYCTPSYRAKLGLTAPDRVTNATLLATTIHPYWQRWLAQFTQLSERAIGAIPAIHFDASHLAIDTAKSDQGIVLTSASLVEQDIASGELIEPFDAPLAVDEGYYLVGPRGTFAKTGPVETLRGWLKQA